MNAPDALHALRPDAPADRISPALGGVPETTLLTLWNRASFASGPQAVLDDPVAVRLLQRIDYDFSGTFKRPYPAHAIRSRWFDEHLQRFLAHSPEGPVVALGEGLETQFWRVDNGRVRWYSVDLPEAIALRGRLLPHHERSLQIACSALDEGWLQAVPADGDAVFVSAAGLFMYFSREETLALLRRIRQRWPRGELVFDTIPHWFSRRTLKGFRGGARYTYPPMPFALALRELPAFLAEAGMHSGQGLTYAQPYPQHMKAFALLSRIGWLRGRIAPGLVHARWGA